METPSGLRRKDTTKGPPLRILSLDGGGVRGYSMLIILQELMYRTYVECEGKAPRRDQIPKPCEHFDLIAGTGTGGLIALMLGRLRMDIETCKEVYIRMTRRVFETDKTIAGIPYRTTLFKASRLEDAIRQCVRDHTVDEEEGNDGTTAASVNPFMRSGYVGSTATLQRRLSRSSISTTTTSVPTSPVSNRGPALGHVWGDPNAKLYDNRENRTKTAVTAVYKGTPKNGSSVLLRSYDSRREPPPEFNCTIWQAGRATSATGLAFKPIQIGQHIFLDEGVGKYNPSPQILDEAVVNEWPGREVGVFVSLGTGKRPQGMTAPAHEWWEDVFRDSLGNFAEARRRLIAKIEGCETTHQFMVKDHLVKRNVPREVYYRFNVEVGVGEFGMNEWSRLAEISTNTRMYLAKNEVQRMNYDAAVRLARIDRMHRRLEARSAAFAAGETLEERKNRPVPPIPQPSSPSRKDENENENENKNVFELPAIELPADEHLQQNQQQHPRPGTSQSSTAVSFASHDDKFTVLPSADGDGLDLPEPISGRCSSEALPASPARQGQDRRPSSSHHGDSVDVQPARPAQQPPPLPPKTPIPYPVSSEDVHAAAVSMPSLPPRSPDRPVSVFGSPRKYRLPYPDDGPPPVNRTRKPTYK
ncbi:putative glycine hydroxymethyltransferase [Microsporum audouinii]